METLIVSADQVSQWRVPPFQRPVRVNAKVAAMAEELKSGTVALSGIITLGKVGRDHALYIVDGQHRIEAFRISGVPEIIADVRIVHFDNMAEMADEFVQLNSALVRMRPDDVLRGLEPTSSAMRAIRSECPFVGYDQIRRGGTSGSILSMNAVIRCWFASAPETPAHTMGGVTGAQAVMTMDPQAVEQMVGFLRTAHSAWGRDAEYYRLWANLNLTLCMWLWRRLVLDRTRGVKRAVVLTEAQFKQCLMSVSADSNYIDWLLGRTTSERDRGPAYQKLKAIFSRRLVLEGVAKPLLPSPSWATR